MKKLKENVHAIQVGCENCGGAHLNKECPEETPKRNVTQRRGPPGYYTRVDNRPPFGEKKPSLEELMNKHIEESPQKRAKMEEWMKKLQEAHYNNTRTKKRFIKGFGANIERLAKRLQSKG
ncbi:hypothetical protein Tco_1523691 [Tanacetum coccineum]